MDSKNNNSAGSATRQTWEKPGMVTIKPTAVWVKPTLERLSLKDAMTAQHTSNIPDATTHS